MRALGPPGGLPFLTCIQGQPKMADMICMLKTHLVAAMKEDNLQVEGVDGRRYDG